MPSTSPASSPTAAPTSTAPDPNVLFAVTEAPSVYEAANKVAIVGLDGVARAKAQFQPRADPVIPSAAPVMGRVAEVVGSGDYYIDGNGILSELRSTGAPQKFTALPSTSAQDDPWFEVSPDGSQAIVGVLTFPDHPTLAVGSYSLGEPGHSAFNSYVTVGGPSKFELFLARRGAQISELQHFETNHLFDSGDPKVPMPVGWTANGPVVVVPWTIVVAASAGFGAWWGGPVCQIDASGRLAGQIGGADCSTGAVSSAGLIACDYGPYLVPRNVDIRDQPGSVLWKATEIWNGGYTHAYGVKWLTISPDGQAISDGTRVDTRFHGLVSIPNGFAVEGWLDDNTVMGRQVIAAGPDMGNLSWINLSAPTVVHDLGFRGDFVGTLS